MRTVSETFPGGSLTHADCSYRSAAGPIHSAWQRDNHEFSLTVEAPTATEIIYPIAHGTNFHTGDEHSPAGCHSLGMSGSTVRSAYLVQ